MDPLQFAYRDNRCTDDAGALARHFVFQHLKSLNRYERTLFTDYIYERILFVDYIYERILFVDYIYERTLFVDYSAVFNMVTPQKLFDKLHLLSQDASICYWLLDFLLQRSQVVKINGIVSSSIFFNTKLPRDVSFPRFYTPYSQKH